MRCIAVLLLFASFTASSQYKSYILGAKGDTLNRIDKNDKRQGKWVNKVESLRGEPGYEEEGIYKDGKKEGTWRAYTLQGDLFAIENYRWGNKNGKSQYFNIAGIVREESWKAVNPENPYDTIEVPDLADPYKVEMKVIKIEGTSVKHGNWKYYDPATGRIVKTETYFLDKLDPNAKFFAEGKVSSDSTASNTVKAPVKTKPKEVVEFEKKLGKKGKKVIDGRTY